MAFVFDPKGRLAIVREDGIFLWKLADADPSASPIALPIFRNRNDYLLERIWPSPDGSRIAVRYVVVGKKEANVNQVELSFFDLRDEDPQSSKKDVLKPADKSTSSGQRRTVFSQNGRWWLDVSVDVAGLLDLDSKGASNLLTLLAPGDSATLVPVTDPAGHWLVTSSVIGGTRLWDLDAADPRAHSIALEMAGSPVTAVFSKDGQWLATGSRDAARVWDLRNLRPGGPAKRGILAPGLDGGLIIGLAVSANGRRLGLLWSDGVIRLAKLNRGETTAALAATLPGYSTLGAPSVAVTPDGSRVISVADDSVAISTVPSNELMEIAQRSVGRNLTREEWKKYIPTAGSYQRTFDSLPEPGAVPEPVVRGEAGFPRNPIAPPG